MTATAANLSNEAYRIAYEVREGRPDLWEECRRSAQSLNAGRTANEYTPQMVYDAAARAYAEEFDN